MISTLRLNPLPYFNVFRLRWIRQPENVFAINHALKGSLKKRNKPFSGCLCTHPILCQRRRFVAYHEQGQAPAPRAAQPFSGCPKHRPASRQPEKSNKPNPPTKAAKIAASSSILLTQPPCSTPPLPSRSGCNAKSPTKP
nr:hypothetical protein [uncultured Kingella sp.]